jgi:hypothetical protein
MAGWIIPKDFYVYAHAKATTGEIFYYGKGRGDRAWSTAGRNSWWRRTVKKHGLKVIIIQDGLQEWAAFELECDMIALGGRRDAGLGPLVNMTDGGEGAAGSIKDSATYIAAFNQPEVKENRKKVKLVQWQDKAHRTSVIEAMKAAHKTPKEKQRKRAATSACHKDPAYRANFLAKRGNKPIVCMSTGQIFETSYCAQKWLVSLGKFAATSSKVRDCCKGKSQSAYGYTWAYA